MNEFWGHDADPTAQGRIQGALPVAVLDIGSNSVRLVVYEWHARSLTPLYNEKSSCALGRGLAQSGRLAYENIDRALMAIQRFALTPEITALGRALDASGAVADLQRERFWSMHHFYSGLEVFKWLVGFSLGARLVIGSRRRSVETRREINLVDEPDHRHVDR